MTTITRRVGSAPDADPEKRVATSGFIPGEPPSIGTDTWGGTFGGTWGRTWFFGFTGTDDTPASPAPDTTRRVSETATANITKRVSGV